GPRGARGVPRDEVRLVQAARLIFSSRLRVSGLRAPPANPQAGFPWEFSSMTDLIPPHGGLSEPVDRTVPAAEAADFTRQAASLKKVPVSDADLSSLYRFGDGGLSPLV